MAPLHAWEFDTLWYLHVDTRKGRKRRPIGDCVGARVTFVGRRWAGLLQLRDGCVTLRRSGDVDIESVLVRIRIRCGMRGLNCLIAPPRPVVPRCQGIVA